MKTIFGLLVLLAGSVLSVTLMRADLASEAADQQFQIIQNTEPRLLPSVGEILPSSGTVRVVINVDADGKLADWMLIESTNQRFADSAIAALKKWNFKPARVRGEAIGVRTELVFNFETHGQVVSMTCVDTVQMLMDRFSQTRSFKHVYRGGELDAIPKAVAMVSPRPVALKEGAAQQGVLVDFYIDETGKPRMATVDTTGDMEMAKSALTALEQWRFTPPTHKGRPVAVRACQWFEFGKAGLAAQ